MITRAARPPCLSRSHHLLLVADRNDLAPEQMRQALEVVLRRSEVNNFLMTMPTSGAVDAQPNQHAGGVLVQSVELVKTGMELTIGQRQQNLVGFFATTEDVGSPVDCRADVRATVALPKRSGVLSDRVISRLEENSLAPEADDGGTNLVVSHRPLDGPARLSGRDIKMRVVDVPRVHRAALIEQHDDLKGSRLVGVIDPAVENIEVLATGAHHISDVEAPILMTTNPAFLSLEEHLANL